MTRVLKTREERWRELWEAFKKCEPSAEDCSELFGFDSMPEDVWLDAYEYVRNMWQKVSMCDLVDWYMSADVRLSKGSGLADPTLFLRDRFSEVMGRLRLHEDKNEHAALLVTLMEATPSGCAESAYYVFKESKSDMAVLLAGLERIEKKNGELVKRIMKDMAVEQMRTHHPQLNQLCALWRYDFSHIDETAKERITAHIIAGDFGTEHQAMWVNMMYEIFTHMPHRQEQVWKRLQGVPCKASHLIVLMCNNPLWRKRAWDRLKEIHPTASEFWEVAKYLGKLREDLDIADEAWQLVRPALPLCDVVWMADKSLRYREDAVNDLLTRDFPTEEMFLEWRDETCQYAVRQILAERLLKTDCDESMKMAIKAQMPRVYEAVCGEKEREYEPMTIEEIRAEMLELEVSDVE